MKSETSATANFYGCISKSAGAAPLPTLDFTGTGPNPRREKKNLKLFSAIAVLTGVLAISPTLASSINLNSGAALEFGQGILETIACSGATAITITPSATFINTGGGGDYYLSSLAVSNIPTDCYGKKFRIRVFGSTDTPLAIFNSTSSIANIIYNAGTFVLGTGRIGMSISSGSGTFIITFTTPVALSSTVEKIGIESSTASCADGSICVVGDTAPGGGKIFYVATTPFACGPTRASTCTYLEAAPSGWNTGSDDPKRTWAQEAYKLTTVSSPETATATAIGWGYRNTRAIVSQGNTTATSAAALADSHTVTVSGVLYDDWYLPSKDELNQMCKWQRGVAWTSDATVCSGGALNSGFGAAGFVDNLYWSSSEANAVGAWLQNFGSGLQSDDYKSGSRYVRLVRAF